ncbi:ParA family protein [Breoghania sp.]|uniref:ParA family protein n=1 Tax=Breoghania sp. TaxID=2065378 RepID=UPI0026221F75|nr:ParA family protein [Breoghania sp.]MDJ0933246.1 ParA family protein [Breoghania sp.]
MSGSVVTIASLKGGSGKTTLATCLAVHWHLKGLNPLLIDADPQRSIMRLAERDKALGGAALLGQADKNVWETIKQQNPGYGVTIVDTPGFDSEITIAALAGRRSGADPSQGLAARRRPDDGYGKEADGMGADISLCADADDAGQRGLPSCARRVEGKRLSAARHRDAEPRRLCGGGPVRRNAEPDGAGGGCCARYRGNSR